MNVEEATKKYAGRTIRIKGNHPWTGELATVVSFDSIGMKVALIRGDAYSGHEVYVTKPNDFAEMIEKNRLFRADKMPPAL